MRKALKQKYGKRIKVFANVEKFGKKPAYRGLPLRTILLINLKDEAGNDLCDHLWLTMGKQLTKLDPKEGDRVSFYARVEKYIKGYFGQRGVYDAPQGIDYKLANPTKFEKHEPTNHPK